MEAKSSGSQLLVTAIAALLLASATGRGDELNPLHAYDELVLAAAVLEKCHLTVSGEASKAKMAAVGNAAFMYLREDLTKENPGLSSDENAQKADFLLKMRMEELLSYDLALIEKKRLCSARGPSTAGDITGAVTLSRHCGPLDNGGTF